MRTMNMTKILKLPILITLLAIGPSLSYAGSETESLSPQLRALLQKEMVALENGMKAIISAYSSGDLEEIEKIASQMKNSYIMKQEITEHQKHELVEKLPKAFLVKDNQFHKYASMLEHVTEEKHTELIGFYYSKLLESCVGCHSEHATKRFPGFDRKSSDANHHH